MTDRERTRRTMTGPPGPRTILDGREVLYFGGSSYLGLHCHPEPIAGAIAAIQEHGVHTATSPSGMGRNDAQIAAESALAVHLDRDRGFHIASGYLGMAAAMAAVSQVVDRVFVDGGLHACGQEAIRSHRLPRVPIPHHDPQHLRLSLRALSPDSRVLVAVDGVDAATGSVAPLPKYAEILSERRGAILLVDDAHGLGVLGDTGRGSVQRAGLEALCNRGTPGLREELTVIQVGTASKALGAHGGVIAGDVEFMDALLRQAPQHAGASAPTAAACGALTAALPLVTKPLIQRARDLAARLRRGLMEIPTADLRLLSQAEDHPLVTFALPAADQMVALEAGLWEREIVVPYIGRYAALKPPGAMRCAVTAAHTEEQVDTLLHNLRELL